jgi:hypothetical protein
MAAPESAVVLWERALGPTSIRLNLDATQAGAYILETVRRLTSHDFVESIEQRGNWFDVYACYRDGLGWFVKMGEDERGLLVLSHHDPERGPLTTVSGRIVEPVDPSIPGKD